MSIELPRFRPLFFSSHKLYRIAIANKRHLLPQTNSVHATSAFGGDGFAFWMLHSSMDPSKAAGAGTLEGPLFGIPDAFQGFGIAFDTYDNDGARDNPAVFVLKNFAADESHAAPAASFSHNADFSQDMVCK